VLDIGGKRLETLSTLAHMINFEDEKPITLAQAAKKLPGKSSDGTLCYQTIYRWVSRGINGVKLETACIGLQRYTSAEAVVRFSRALTSIRDNSLANSAQFTRRKKSDEATAILRHLKNEHGLT
jgi:hypothetical protein